MPRTPSVRRQALKHHKCEEGYVACNNCSEIYVEEVDLVICRVDEFDDPVLEGGELIKGCPECLTDAFLADAYNTEED